LKNSGGLRTGFGVDSTVPSDSVRKLANGRPRVCGPSTNPINCAIRDRSTTIRPLFPAFGAATNRKRRCCGCDPVARSPRACCPFGRLPEMRLVQPAPVGCCVQTLGESLLNTREHHASYASVYVCVCQRPGPSTCPSVETHPPALVDDLRLRFLGIIIIDHHTSWLFLPALGIAGTPADVGPRRQASAARTVDPLRGPLTYGVRAESGPTSPPRVERRLAMGRVLDHVMTYPSAIPMESRP
jgi:hypothetical protein